MKGIQEKDTREWGTVAYPNRDFNKIQKIFQDYRFAVRLLRSMSEPLGGFVELLPDRQDLQDFKSCQ
ncbi:hypothetical protein CWM47_06700 [Spirosoma pollinicola]|uniref:Uncharacterized protein n=1 Tax=Spirosoma pollinicola TaxID=2057025 RepID=A0A2K8YV66_9BACT|nr:hypothetical protein CWM47_06700 [Spirosoma pollinicola]